jgi:UDP-N-acetylmuramoylalanine--D-glutamate ligase
MVERHGGRALILGLGRFGGGREAALHLRRRGWRIRVADDAPAEKLAAEIAALQAAMDVEWRLGAAPHDALEGVELVVVNPGVRPDHPTVALAQQRGIRLTQEVNLVLEAFPGRVVLITGTNGKSTTSSLIARALRASGIDALLGGNIGHSLLADETGWHAAAVAVLEISSFQLERVDPQQHAVSGAVLARVTVDHLDRHGSLAAYQRAKSVAAAVARDFLVHQADDAVACGFASPARLRVRCTQDMPRPGEVGYRDGWVWSALDDAGPVLHAAALHLLGAFQIENVMAAYAAAVSLGARRHACALGLAAQRPLPYRLQRLLTRDGIELYDNSVSTEVQSTLSALLTLSAPIHWVGGGKSKDGDYEAVASAIASRAASAHVFGAAAAPLADLLRARLPVTRHGSLEEALDAAWKSARTGERVLFSPAFASFDQFPNFRFRAEAFHSWATRRLAYNPPAAANRLATRSADG